MTWEGDDGRIRGGLRKVRILGHSGYLVPGRYYNRVHLECESAALLLS
jgi:hypothetical protein